MYLCYKAAYLKAIRTKNQPPCKSLIQTDEILGHSESPLLQYSARENLTLGISIFSIARRHTNTQKARVGSDYRRSHFLNNFVATPVSENDAAAYLYRAVNTSLVDTVYALWVLLNLKSDYPKFFPTLKAELDNKILDALVDAQSEVSALDLPTFDSEAIQNEERKSLGYYRYCAAFLEFPDLCKFRNDIDKVIGLRLISPLCPIRHPWPAEPYDDFKILRQKDGNFDIKTHNSGKVQVDSFYRTYLFLRLIQDPINLSHLEEDDFKYIFNNTMGLDALLIERELDSIHLSASEESRPIVEVLALALHRSRSSDPDVEFAYRTRLVALVIEKFQRSIPRFIYSLIEKYPAIAHYLAISLDEQTLQKMYGLINSSKEASLARKEILYAIGHATNRIEFIVEAEAIETRNKVANLTKYFDTSRMFVDSVAMKGWLDSNPSAYTQEYKELCPRMVETITSVPEVLDHSTGAVKQRTVITVSPTASHLVEQIAGAAFKEFCTNTEFGIESYLGRRIRHNTLLGVMTDPIDDILTKAPYQPVLVRTKFGSAIDYWFNQYKLFIDKMRREFLQFRSSNTPNALFSPALDLSDSATERAVTQLSKVLELSGSEMLTDLVIEFCWNQIGPQLDHASRQIKINMAGNVKQMLTSNLSQFRGREEQIIVSELDEAVGSVFFKVSSWFRLPETGFVPASIEELCNIIDIEFKRQETATNVTGNSLNTRYYGISVHRLYDCLAVLIQNAMKHGDPHSAVSVDVFAEEIPQTNLQRVAVSVFSVVDLDEMEKSIDRIREALQASESGRDMVTEGYTGLKKVKYITKLNEGRHTVMASCKGNELEVRFSLRAEVANESSRDEKGIAD